MILSDDLAAVVAPSFVDASCSKYLIGLGGPAQDVGEGNEISM